MAGDQFRGDHYFEVYARRNIGGVRSSVTWVVKVRSMARFQAHCRCYRDSEKMLEHSPGWLLVVTEINETTFDRMRLLGYGREFEFVG